MIQYRGRILIPSTSQCFDYCDDAIITVEDGKTTGIREAKANDTIQTTHPGCVWAPGFVDSHVHFPQTKIIGSASGELLPWLNTSVFPEESKFVDEAYAKKTAVEFCNSLIEAGTVGAVIYSSSHPTATDVLFETLDESGLKAIAGMTLMDRNAPEVLLRDAKTALSDMTKLIERWHGRDDNRLQYCITPRFAISCSPELLAIAGQLAKEKGLWIQTHLSENSDEIDFTLELFPKATNYLDVYEHFGLVSNKSIFAHCIHLKESEIEQIKDRQSIVAHCPDSNFFLGSGCMPLNKYDEMGLNLSLGSDVGAGRTFSMTTIGGRAYDVSLLNQDPVSPERILWLATTNASRLLGFSSAETHDADFSVFKVPIGLSKSDIIDALLFRHDRTKAEAVYVRGKRLTELRHQD